MERWRKGFKASGACLIEWNAYLLERPHDGAKEVWVPAAPKKCELARPGFSKGPEHWIHPSFRRRRTTKRYERRAALPGRAALDHFADDFASRICIFWLDQQAMFTRIRFRARRDAVFTKAVAEDLRHPLVVPGPDDGGSRRGVPVLRNLPLRRARQLFLIARVSLDRRFRRLPVEHAFRDALRARQIGSIDANLETARGVVYAGKW